MNINIHLTPSLNEYTGGYHSEELETDYKITLNNNKLNIYHIRLEDVGLDDDLAIKDQFCSPVGSIAFVRNSEGKITGVKLSGEGLRISGLSVNRSLVTSVTP